MQLVLVHARCGGTSYGTADVSDKIVKFQVSSFRERDEADLPPIKLQ